MRGPTLPGRRALPRRPHHYRPAMPGDPPAEAEPSVMPSVSFVLPAHNEEDMLQATVGDIVTGLRDRGSTFEVIVVENGSTGATATIGECLAGAHPEVRSLSSDEPDYGKALRRGLLASTGEVVVNFDVDY